MEANELNFEAAFLRLEEILEKMNAGGISLDESLKYYEEADKLIAQCQKNLNNAEQTIKLLVKKRNQEVLDANQKPLTEDFNTFKDKP